MTFEQGYGIAGLVGLQVADQVPARPSGDNGNFRPGFLHFALAENRLARRQSGLHELPVQSLYSRKSA